MRDLKKYAKECIEELMTYGIDCRRFYDGLEWKVSTRSKRRMGACWFKGGEPKEIRISSYMLDDTIVKDDIHLRDTIIHELLHALCPDDGHGGNWLRLAKQVNSRSKGKYEIQRCGNLKEMGITAEQLKFKYIVRCNKCGAEFGHQRKCKVVIHPSWYSCGHCGGSLRVDKG